VLEDAVAKKSFQRKECGREIYEVVNGDGRLKQVKRIAEGETMYLLVCKDQAEEGPVSTPFTLTALLGTAHAGRQSTGEARRKERTELEAARPQLDGTRRRRSRRRSTLGRRRERKDRHRSARKSRNERSLSGDS
jgi:hypothetical protein